MNHHFPYTIKNGHGEFITFKGIVIRDGQEFLEVDNVVEPKAGPPMHVHHKQDEVVQVVTGKIGYQLLHGPELFAGPGEWVTFKARVPHRFWNAGTELLTCTGYISPAYNIIYFLDEIFKSTAKNGGKPGIYDSAFLLTRYRSEFDMLEIPGFVKKVILPVVLFFGNLTGRRNRFPDAPVPVK